MYTETYNDKYTIYIGRSQEENQVLVSKTKKMNQNALWFHVGNGFSSPHGFVVNKSTKNTTIKYDKDVILRTATLVKQYSKESIKMLHAVTIEYIAIKYVESTDVPGKVRLKKTPNKVIV
jgi:predicted ribosome quality control (RQC) complex YloA/Tae2 family protein